MEWVLWSPVGLFHVNTGGVDAVANANEDKTIATLLIQLLDEAVLNLHRVDPKSEGALLASTLNIVVDYTCLLDFFLSKLLQTMLAVENCGNEN